jgi:hypothetical protein
VILAPIFLDESLVDCFWINKRRCAPSLTQQPFAHRLVFRRQLDVVHVVKVQGEPFCELAVRHVDLALGARHAPLKPQVCQKGIKALFAHEEVVRGDVM